MVFCGEPTSSFIAEQLYYACPLISSVGRCWLQSMDGSLPPPLLQNRACHFCGTRLLSDAPFDIGTRLAVEDRQRDL
jgi:hypothetical protein